MIDLSKYKDTPDFMTEEGIKTLKSGYLGKDETIKEMYYRVVTSAVNHLEGIRNIDPLLEQRLFDYLYNNWLCLSSPIIMNAGKPKGLPISCYVIPLEDSIYHINHGTTEMAMLTKNGGGVGVSWDNVRAKGTPISFSGAYSEGVIPFMKQYDSTILATSQGSMRRGAASANLSINHGDWEDFIKMRRPEGDENRRCQNLHHCTDIPNIFMEELPVNKAHIHKWAELLKTRMETGESYISFRDNIQKFKPIWYSNYRFSGTNICCVTGDTLILTDKGHIKIIDCIGKKVNVWDGYEFVEVTPEETGNKNCVLVTLSNGAQLKVSDNHKFAIIGNYNDNRTSKYILKEIKDLSIDTKLAKFKHPVIENFVENPKVDAYSQGFYSGDGNTDLEYSWIYRPKYDCKSRLVGEISVENTSNNRCTWKHGKMLSKNFVPFQASIEYKINWLSGLFDADGSLVSNMIQLASVDFDFLNNLRLLLNTLGIDSKINFAREKGFYKLPDGKGGLKEYNCKEIQRILINSKQLKQLISLGLSCERIKLKSVNETNRDCTANVKIVKIEPIGNHDTYCFNNPKRGLGCFNGVVTGQSEIIPFIKLDEIFVCDLSSVNISRYNEWKDNPQFIRDIVFFLNGILNEFIEKASKELGFERAVNFATRHRSIGIGWLGLHTYLQENSIPFVSMQHKYLTDIIGRKMWEQGWEASKEFAQLYGEPEVMKGHGYGNAQLFAIAPTTSNSLISGGISQGVEPIIKNVYNQKSAKGTFIRKNNTLDNLIQTKYKLVKDTPKYDEFWQNVLENNGSVQQIDFMDDLDKEVFLTFVEINQLELVKLAVQRQKYVDQAQSINLCFPNNVPTEWLNKVHYEAWKLGLKTLYYVRTESPLRGDIASKTFSDCVYCES